MHLDTNVWIPLQFASTQRVFVAAMPADRKEMMLGMKYKKEKQKKKNTTNVSLSPRASSAR